MAEREYYPYEYDITLKCSCGESVYMSDAACYFDEVVTCDSCGRQYQYAVKCIEIEREGK